MRSSWAHLGQELSGRASTWATCASELGRVRVTVCAVCVTTVCVLRVQPPRAALGGRCRGAGGASRDGSVISPERARSEKQNTRLPSSKFIFIFLNRSNIRIECTHPHGVRTHATHAHRKSSERPVIHATAATRSYRLHSSDTAQTKPGLIPWWVIPRRARRRRARPLRSDHSAPHTRP